MSSQGWLPASIHKGHVWVLECVIILHSQCCAWSPNIVIDRSSLFNIQRTKWPLLKHCQILIQSGLIPVSDHGDRSQISQTTMPYIFLQRKTQSFLSHAYKNTSNVWTIICNQSLFNLSKFYPPPTGPNFAGLSKFSSPGVTVQPLVLNTVIHAIPLSFLLQYSTRIQCLYFRICAFHKFTTAVYHQNITFLMYLQCWQWKDIILFSIL